MVEIRGGEVGSVVDEAEGGFCAVEGGLGGVGGFLLLDFLGLDDLVFELVEFVEEELDVVAVGLVLGSLLFELLHFFFVLLDHLGDGDLLGLLGDVLADFVFDFAGAHAEAEGAESLVDLGDAGVDAEDDAGAGVAAEGGPHDFGEDGVPVGDVDFGFALALELDALGEEEDAFVDIFAFVGAVLLLVGAHFFAAGEVDEVEHGLVDLEVVGLSEGDALHVEAENRMRPAAAVVHLGLCVVSVHFTSCEYLEDFLEVGGDFSAGVFDIEFSLMGWIFFFLIIGFELIIREGGDSFLHQLLH